MDESRKKKARKTSQFAEIWHRLKKNKMAMAGLYILLFILVASLFGPLISIYQYDVQDYAVRSQFPSLSHLFGTDNFGRDILTRIMVGGRYTLFIALVCVTSSAIIGSLLGLIAAYYPKVDNIIMRIIDIFMGIPTMMLCVSIVAALGSSMRNMMIALIVTQSPEFARIMRAQVLTVKDKEYIEAARSIGCSNARIIFSHIGAERARADHCAVYAWRGQCYSDERVAELCRHGRSAADAGMGPYDLGRQRLSQRLLAYRDYSRPCDRRFRVCTEYARRRLRDALDPRLKQ